MKKIFLLSLVALIFLLPALECKSQNFNDAGEYISYIGNEYKEITKNMLIYTSSVAHGKSARKVENKRKEVVQSNRDARKKIAAMPPFKGDKSLRDSAVGYLDLSYRILNDDYGKIVNMEEGSEQSYDAMEAYLVAQEMANKKLNAAENRLSDTEKKFAAKYKVKLVDTNDEISKKMAQASRVNEYDRVIYLIFFKAYKQEYHLFDAINKKNVSGIEQNKNTLQQYSDEGLAKLDTIKAFNGDISLIQACRQVLQFYKEECSKVHVNTNFLIKGENFAKIKDAFDAKKESERKQADADQYNKAANELNQAVDELNQTTIELNGKRSKAIDGWNKTSADFMAKYTPKYR